MELTSTRNQTGPNQKGQALIEYALLLTGMGVAVLGILLLLGPQIGAVFSGVTARFAGAAAGTETTGTDGTPAGFQVMVADAAGQGVPDVTVYAYFDSGRYSGVTAVTDEAGYATFSGLEPAAYEFRANLQLVWFHSPTVTWPAAATTTLPTTLRDVVVDMVGHDGAPIAGSFVKAYDEQGRGVNAEGITDEQGRVVLRMIAGVFSFQGYYRSHTYWSPRIDTGAVQSARIDTGERRFPVSVVDARGKGIDGVTVQALTATGGWVSVSAATDRDGTAYLLLPYGSFKFSIEHRATRFTSTVVDTKEDEMARIETGEQTFTVYVVDGNGKGIKDVKVEFFTVEGNWAGISGETNGSGKVKVDVPAGRYKVRAIYLQSTFWSADLDTARTESTVIETGERTYAVYVVDANGEGIKDVPVYAFRAGDVYTGRHDETDSKGVAELRLPAGDYLFRADYQRSYYWSPRVGGGATEVKIATGQRPVTVLVLRGDRPVAGVRVKALTADGDIYFGASDVTGRDGTVTLALADGNYRFAVNQGRDVFTTGFITTPGTTYLKVALED